MPWLVVQDEHSPDKGSQMRKSVPLKLPHLQKEIRLTSSIARLNNMQRQRGSRIQRDVDDTIMPLDGVWTLSGHRFV